jgi:hypothetical protein
MVGSLASGAMRRPFLLLTLAGLLVRIAFLLVEPSSALAGDEHTWTSWGQVLAGSDVAFSPVKLRLIFYPPLYAYFIGVAYRAFGSFPAVKACQAVASALLIPAVGRIGSRVFGERAGALAAAVAAFYPDLVWFSVHFWSETLFLVLLWWAFERLVAADAASSRGAALVAGLLWGLAILARETPLYFTPVAALWLAWRRGSDRGGPRALAFLLAAALTVAPWTLRNFVVYRAFVPVSTGGALNLWQGNARLTRQEVYDRYAQVHGRIEKYRFATRAGIEAILERQPAWLLEKLAGEMPLFWEADSLVLVHIKRGAYGVVPLAVGVAAAVLVLAPYLALLPFFVLGVAAGRFDRSRTLLLLFLIYYNLLHVATHGFARYRLPIMPILFVFASWAIAEWRSRRLPALGAWRTALAAALAVALVASVVPSLTSDWAEPSYVGVDDSAS